MIKLSDVCTKAASNIAQKDLDTRNGCYPIYGAGGFIKNVDFYHQDKPYIAIVKDGAGVGRVMRLPGKSSVIGTMQYIIPNDGVDVSYLAYALEHMNLGKYYLGAAIPHIYFKDYCNEGLPAHTYEEQHEIAASLDKVSDLIALRKEQLTKLEQLVKSRFIELFESKQWETVWTGTIMFNMRNGVSPSNNGTHPAKVLTLSAITQGDFDPTSWKDGMFEVDPPIEKRVTASDFYMCRGNGNKNLVGAGVYSKEDRYDLVFPDTAIAATVDLQRVCLPYLFHAWKRPSVREQIETGARTTNGTYKINQGVVSNIELNLPPLDIQKQFAAFVEQTDKSKLAIQQSLDKLELLKKSLMQKYFG